MKAFASKTTLFANEMNEINEMSEINEPIDAINPSPIYGTVKLKLEHQKVVSFVTP